MRTKLPLNTWTMVSIIVVVFTILIITYSHKPAQESTVEQMLAHQDDFIQNTWFNQADKSGGPWEGVVLTQRELLPGLYETKILRDGDKFVFLALAGKVLAKDARVEFSWYYSSSSKFGSYEGRVFLIQ
jgi:hypothetical protein